MLPRRPSPLGSFRVFAAAAAVSLWACNEIPVELPAPTGIRLSQSAVTMYVGEQRDLGAQVIDQDGRTMAGRPVLWSSSNLSVATVTTNGVVTARSVGAADITASIDTILATVTITVSNGASVVLTPETIQLFAGLNQGITARVTGPGGADVTNATVTWRSTNPSVAIVGAVGINQTVSAIGAGTANIIAEALGKADTTPVTVVTDARQLAVRLDIVQDSVTVDLNTATPPLIDYHVFDGFNRDVCANANFAPSKYRSDASVAVSTGFQNNCQFGIQLNGPGRTFVVAEINNVRDSVLMIVTNNMYAATLTAPPPTVLRRAGDTLAYQVRVIDQANRPAAGIRVNFAVTGGTTSVASAVTDASGLASVNWHLPQFPIASGGTLHTLRVASQGPNGALTNTINRNENVVPAVASRFTFWSDAANTDSVQADTTTIGFFGNVFVQSYDRFSNVRNTAASLSVSNPDMADIRLLAPPPGAATNQRIQSSGVQLGTVSVTVTENNVSRTIPILIQAGPTIVFKPSANSSIRVGQVTSAFTDTIAYNGALPSAYPTFTMRRDTVVFLLNPGGVPANGWVPNAAATNGSNVAAPIALLTADFANSYAWGFPAFETQTDKMGNMLFISDSLGVNNSKSNVYRYNRLTNAVTRLTGNTNRFVRYVGLSLSPDGTRALVATQRIVAGTTPDSSVASNVFEVNLATGVLTQLTSNTDFSAGFGAVYRNASYDPSGALIYIDRLGFNGRQLLVKNGSAFMEFDVGGTGEYVPTFAFGDPNTIAYLDANQIFIRLVTAGQAAERPARTAIGHFSWSKR